MKTRNRHLATLGLLLATMSVLALAAGNANVFQAHLSGAAEVGPVDTLATEHALFQLNKDGDELSYKLIVANIEDVIMAHIHLAPAGANGGVVVWLYNAPAVGPVNGILAEGTITAADLVGALAGHPLSDLIDTIRAGGAYVNVHTLAHPGGEIRGQIQ